MLINLRNALMAGKRLPYDAEVEYLQSSGNSSSTVKMWINTGVEALANTAMEVTFQYTGTGFGCVMGQGWLSGCRFGVAGIRNNSRLWSLAYNNWYDFSVGADTAIHTFKLDGATKTGSVDSATISFSDTYTSEGGTIGLFCRNCNGGTTQNWGCNGKLYSCKIWQNGVLVRDFIPVRKGTVGYLYDRVSGKLFGNAGTGDFVLGPDVVPVEWLEGDGNSYIDLGIRPTAPEIDIEAEARYVGTVSVGLLSAGQASPRLEFYNWGSTLQAYCGTYTTTNFLLAVGDRISITTSNGNIVLKNITREVTANGTYTFNGQAAETASIWGLHRSGAYSFIGKWRVFRAYVDSLKCLPVRVGTDATSWEGAMMDALTRRIYRNAGTGAFGYGNDLKYPIPAS